jgi:ABC-type glutathione transport system ATPase component
LWKIDLSLRSNEVVGVVGESGCGKTTLGRIAAALLKPTEGTVLIDSRVPDPDDAKAWLTLRRRVRMIFQSPAAALNPFLKVRTLCEEPIRVHEPRVPGPERRRRVEDLARLLEFDRLDRYPRLLSGGEKRRASLVRALAVPFDLLIADEPTAGLDSALELQILRTIERFRSDWKAGMLLISHHLGVIEAIADEVLVLYRGEVVEQARTARKPLQGAHPYTRRLWKAGRLERSRTDEILRDGVVSFETPVGDGCVYRDACSLRTRLPQVERLRCEKESPELQDVSPSDVPSVGMEHRAACHHLARAASDSD